MLRSGEHFCCPCKCNMVLFSAWTCAVINTCTQVTSQSSNKMHSESMGCFRSNHPPSKYTSVHLIGDMMGQSENTQVHGWQMHVRHFPLQAGVHDLYTGAKPCQAIGSDYGSQGHTPCPELIPTSDWVLYLSACICRDWWDLYSVSSPTVVTLDITRQRLFYICLKDHRRGNRILDHCGKK